MRLCLHWTSGPYGRLEPRMTSAVLGRTIGVETWDKVFGIQNLMGPFSSDNTPPTVLCPMESVFQVRVERRIIQTDGNPPDGLN